MNIGIPIQQGSSHRLDIGARIFWIYSRPSRDVHLVEGDVTVDYEDVCDDLINHKMICRLSNVLIRVGRACVHL